MDKAPTEEMRLNAKLPLTMCCDNQMTIHITLKCVFHKWTKHLEMDDHLVQEKVENRVIAAPYVFTRAQILDMFTKPFCKTRLNNYATSRDYMSQLEGECH